MSWVPHTSIENSTFSFGTSWGVCMRPSKYNIWVGQPDATYIYNGVSGALLKIPLEEAAPLQRYLGGGSIEQCSPQLLEKLALGRMLINDDTDELGLLASRYAATRSGLSRFALTVVTNLGCNFACPYCFEDKHAFVMDENVQEATCNLVESKLLAADTFHVMWYGGEPLLGKAALLRLSKRFIELARNANVEYSAQIVTNGYLLDESCCRELADHRVSEVQVCLDGPPEVHDRMRPLVSGRGSFHRIVHNLHHAVKYFDIVVRMNVSSENVSHAEELLRTLAKEGFGGRITVYPGQIVAVNDGAPSPSTQYSPACLRPREFSQFELAFKRLAVQYGFLTPTLPLPAGAPCTAVRANELVVGSKGELYKCVESVGNPLEVVGSVFDWDNPNNRLRKWLAYDPFSDPECRNCVAMPVCMGGCAHHGMDLLQYENRCDSFRFNHAERVRDFIEAAKSADQDGLQFTSRLTHRMDTR